MKLWEEIAIAVGLATTIAMMILLKTSGVPMNLEFWVTAICVVCAFGGFLATFILCRLDDKGIIDLDSRDKQLRRLVKWIREDQEGTNETRFDKRWSGGKRY